jgi:hypothetical protein
MNSPAFRDSGRAGAWTGASTISYDPNDRESPSGRKADHAEPGMMMAWLDARLERHRARPAG